MSEDPEAAIAAAMTLRGPVVPLKVLGLAADWAARTVLPDIGEDDVAAFECVVALDDAMPRLGELLGHIPALVHVASPGSGVIERLATASAELGRQRAALEAERAKLEAVRDLERQVREVEAERDQLRTSIEQLERRQVIEQELPVLRARRAELDAAISDIDAGSGEEIVRGLGDAAQRLLELTDEQRSLLEARNDRLVPAIAAAAEAAARELDRSNQLAAELAARQQEAADLRADHERTFPALEARRQADQDLLRGLAAAGLSSGASALERVQAELAEVERRIENAEGFLKPLLRQHAKAYEETRQIRGLA